MSTEATTALEQSAQGDPTEVNAADLLAEATLDMISGNRNFTDLSAKQQATYEELTKPKAETPEVKPAESEPTTTEVVEETPTETVEETDATVDETEAEEVPTGETPKEEPAKESAERFRFKDDEDKAILQLARARKIPVREATSIYDKMFPKEAEPQAQAASVATTPEVQALESQVAALEAKLDGAEEGLVTKELLKDQREFSKAVAALERARMVAAQQASAEAAFETDRQSVMSKTVEAYPEMGNRNSPQYLIAARLADEAANDPKHPDHKPGQTLDAPRYFADKAAVLLKLKPGTKAATTVATEKPVKQPPKPSPASGNKGTQPAKADETIDLDAVTAKTLEMISGGGQHHNRSPILIN